MKQPTNHLLKSAVISECGQFRYQLERLSAKRTSRKSTVTFIGLNPSTADASQDDPTIRRCIQFAHSWEFKTLIVVNLFAFRATKPIDLFKAPDPIGTENDAYIEQAISRASMVIACWGEHGVRNDRACYVRRRYQRRLSALRINRSGQPAHPLYLPGSLKPVKLSALAAALKKN